MSLRLKVLVNLAITSLIFLLFLGGMNSAFANGATCPSTVNYGQTISCSIAAPNESDSFAFSANAGDVVTVLIAKTSGNLWPGMSLRSPGGNELCGDGGPGSSEITSCALPSTGTYTILVNDSFNGTFTGDYNLTLERLNPGTGPSIYFGQSVSGTLLAGDLNSHVFSANGGDKVAVTMTTISGSLWPGISLYSPDGVELCKEGKPSSAEIGSCTIPSSGTYTLLVYDSFNGTLAGNYSLFLGLYPETVSVPNVPLGMQEGTMNNSYSYSTGGSSSSFGHTIQYFFDWGDGTNSGWLSAGTTSASHLWSAPGTYSVKVQSRCSRDPLVVSTWSGALGVMIKEPEPIQVWHQRYSLPSDDLLMLTAAAYGNNTFVAVGSMGEILTSTDGIGWTERERGVFTEYWFWDVTYAEDMFVAVGSEGSVITSSDGIDWTERTSPAWGLFGVTHGNNIFVAVGTLSTIVTSSDGKSWTKRNSGVSIPSEHFVTFQKVAYGNNTFVAVGNISDFYGHDQGIILTSPDGKSWTSRDPGHGSFTGITYGNGIFVTVGEDVILTSTDGIDWAQKTFESHGAILAISYGNGTFVAVGENGTILTSPDGISWENINSGSNDYLLGITYGNHTFVAVGDVILQSDPILTEIETISPPNTPVGPANCEMGISCAYSTGGSFSNLGHTLEYQFDWRGDGSDLSSWGAGMQSKVWTTAGTYSVRSRARCETDANIVSPWSNALTVNITSAFLPDLTGQWISLAQTCKSTKGRLKCKISGKLNVRNSGNLDVSSYTVNFYLSNEETYEEGNTFLKQAVMGKLKAGGSKDIKFSYNLPLNETATGKYIVTLIDADNTILEADENNNRIVHGPI